MGASFGPISSCCIAVCCCYRVSRRRVCREVQTFSLQLGAGGGREVWVTLGAIRAGCYQDCDAFDDGAPLSSPWPTDGQVAREGEAFGTQHICHIG